MGWFFLFFLVSGFCSILYEIVWLRLSMAQFGVTTALVSIVLSMFMAGLGLGLVGSGLRHPALRRTYQDSRAAHLRVRRIADRAFRAGCTRRTVLGTTLAGARLNFLVVGLLLLLRRVGGPDTDSVVRLYGGYDSAGHAGHPQEFSAGSPPVLQLSLPGECLGRGGGCDRAFAADRNLRISRHTQNRCDAEWSAVCIGHGS